MNENQNKYIGLTMELDLKAREYKMLCDKLDKLKEENIDPNDDRLIALKEMFITNSEEIKAINEELRKLKTDVDIAEETKIKEYNPEDLFKNKSSVDKENKQEDQVPAVKKKENAFSKLINKIKNIFHKN